MDGMNKKGFTLVEIMAVIGLLSIVVVLAVPAIINIRKNILLKEDASQINSIESAAVYYAQDTGTTGIICVDKLLETGYLDPTYKYNTNGCTSINGCLIRPSDNQLLNLKKVTISKTGIKTKAIYDASANCN